MAQSLFALLGIAVVLFAWTHIDDLFVLIVFFSDRQFRAHHVVLGQYLGISVIFGASLLASLLAIVIPPAYIGLLGVAPICLGIAKLYSAWRGTPRRQQQQKRASARVGRNIFAMTLATLANSGDNISIYTPLFATRSSLQVTLVGLVFAGMTGLWCWLGYWLVHHPALGGPLRRYGHMTLPYLLIGFGIYILYQAGTFTLIR